MDRSEAGKKGYEASKDKLDAYRKKRTRDSIQRYEDNPKLCPTCNTQIPYEKRVNKFCSKSCSASFNNRGKVRVKTTRSKTCAHCGAVKESRQNKYCKACSDACVYSRVYDTEEASQDSTRRRILFETRGHQCESCGLSEWMEQPIPLELDHIDGDPDNNAEDNLRLICPNCHAQTDTYKGANVGGESSRQKMRRKRYKQGKTY